MSFGVFGCCAIISILQIVQLATYFKDYRGYWQYQWFFRYGDRDRDGKIDDGDITLIRNPVWLKEWHTFGINEFLPVDEFTFQMFIEGSFLNIWPTSLQRKINTFFS